MTHKLSPEEVYRKLLEVANRDGIVTADEQIILETVKSNIQKYYRVVDDSFADEIITPDEQHRMYEIRKEILEEALGVAKLDDKITQDEYRLLREIKRILVELEMDEHY